MRRLLNIIQYMHGHEESGLVLSLDTEKARRKSTALSFEPAALRPGHRAIRQSPVISGVFVEEKEHTINLYADDVLLFLTNPNLSVPCVIDTIAKCSYFSGYKINLSKSEAMPLGSLQTVPHAPDPFHWFCLFRHDSIYGGLSQFNITPSLNSGEP